MYTCTYTYTYVQVVTWLTESPPDYRSHVSVDHGHVHTFELLANSNFHMCTHARAQHALFPALARVSYVLVVYYCKL